MPNFSPGTAARHSVRNIVATPLEANLNTLRYLDLKIWAPIGFCCISSSDKMTVGVSNMNPCLDPNATLGIDQACLSIWNKYNYNVEFYSRPSECHLCDGEPPTMLLANHNTTLVISTKYPLHVYYKAAYVYCHTTYTFNEHGSYGWNISQEDLCSDFYILRTANNIYLPILIAFMVLILTGISASIFNILLRLIKRKLSTENVLDDLDRLQETDSTTHPVIRTTKASTRIRSVDTFRGIAILLMIFVNNKGGGYVFFNHSAWNGLTVADLVLPWFAWIMGLTITISKRAELRVTTSRLKSILRGLQRSIILILLGVMLNSIHNNSLSSLRFTGVLQMLGVSYFICATIETIFMKAHSQFGRFSILRDILDSWPQWIFVLSTMTLHILITFLLPVPNCPTRYLGPGGYEHFNRFPNCTGGAAGYIDRLVFGNHMYFHKENAVYGPILPHDPEGIMNTISIIFLVYMGVHAGKILMLYYQCSSRVIRWLLWAAVTGITAGILCNFSKEEGVIPVSKKMMSLSFILTVSSFAFILYAFLYIIIDYKQYWNGTPFIYAGTNPIVLYVGHIMTMGLFPWAWKLTHATHASLLAMNIWTTVLWMLIGWWLYVKDIIITL
ncbi:hypothetical protein KM043_015863 [Ampulex compressa]|nr:hypothetical protein KM043_015863 [Ampulex compressa]